MLRTSQMIKLATVCMKVYGMIKPPYLGLVLSSPFVREYLALTRAQFCRWICASAFLITWSLRKEQHCTAHSVARENGNGAAQPAGGTCWVVPGHSKREVKNCLLISVHFWLGFLLIKPGSGFFMSNTKN